MGQASYEEHFPSWDDGVAAGRMEVEFIAGTTIVKQGFVTVGICAQCSLDTCPTSQQLEIEAIRFSDTNVDPSNIECYSCEGDGRLVRACR